HDNASTGCAAVHPLTVDKIPLSRLCHKAAVSRIDLYEHAAFSVIGIQVFPNDSAVVIQSQAEVYQCVDGGQLSGLWVGFNITVPAKEATLIFQPVQLHGETPVFVYQGNGSVHLFGNICR